MEAVLERKIKLVKEILDDKTSDGMLNSLEKLYQRLVSNAPCAYSQQEMEERLTVSEKDFEIGRGIPHEQIKRK